MKRALADTHSVIWARSKPEALGESARELFSDLENEVFVSAGAFFEMAIKQSIGKLDLGTSVFQFSRSCIEEFGLTLLPVRLEHIAILESLPFVQHRDPFDRLLVSQAIAEKIPMISRDSVLDQYGVVRIWE